MEAFIACQLVLPASCGCFPSAPSPWRCSLPMTGRSRRVSLPQAWEPQHRWRRKRRGHGRGSGHVLGHKGQAGPAASPHRVLAVVTAEPSPSMSGWGRRRLGPALAKWTAGEFAAQIKRRHLAGDVEVWLKQRLRGAVRQGNRSPAQSSDQRPTEPQPTSGATSGPHHVNKRRQVSTGADNPKALVTDAFGS